MANNPNNPIDTLEQSSRPKRNKNFYAVSKGRSVGIFEEWSRVKLATEKITNCYKGYANIDQAVDHMIQGGHAKENITVTDRKGVAHKLEHYLLKMKNRSNDTVTSEEITTQEHRPTEESPVAIEQDSMHKTTETPRKVKSVKDKSQSSSSPASKCPNCGHELDRLARATEGIDKAVAKIVPEVNDIKGSIESLYVNSETVLNNTKSIMNDLLLSQAAIEKELENFKKCVNLQNKNISAATTTITSATSSTTLLLENLQKEKAAMNDTVLSSNQRIMDEIHKVQMEIDALGNFIDYRFEDCLARKPLQIAQEEGKSPEATQRPAGPTMDRSYAEVTRPKERNVNPHPSPTTGTRTPKSSRKTNNARRVSEQEGTCKESVLLCADSTCNDIDTERLCQNITAKMTKKKTSTIKDIGKLNSNACNEYELIILHTGINDLRHAYNVEDIAVLAHSLVQEADRLAHKTNVIISGVLPSPDTELDERIFLFNNYVQQFMWNLYNYKYISYMSNNNFVRRGEVQERFYRDNIHPSRDGTSVLSANIIRAMLKSYRGITPVNSHQ